tara:strand:- start:7 stop:339 length:333 start_codon:yes stop_codon:yes gene_type:complete
MENLFDALAHGLSVAAQDLTDIRDATMTELLGFQTRVPPTVPLVQGAKEVSHALFSFFAERNDCHEYASCRKTPSPDSNSLEQRRRNWGSYFVGVATPTGCRLDAAVPPV